MSSERESRQDFCGQPFNAHCDQFSVWFLLLNFLLKLLGRPRGMSPPCIFSFLQLNIISLRIRHGSSDLTRTMQKWQQLGFHLSR
jgi:hypothetical protein